MKFPGLNYSFTLLLLFTFSCQPNPARLETSSVEISQVSDTSRKAELIVFFDPVSRITEFKNPDGSLFSGYVLDKENGGHFVWKVKNGFGVEQIGYYGSGKIERRLEMKKGIEHGEFKMWFEDGKPYVDQHYRDGKSVGVWKRWDNQGNLIEEIDNNLGEMKETKIH